MPLGGTPLTSGYISINILTFRECPKSVEPSGSISDATLYPPALSIFRRMPLASRILATW